MNTNKRILMTMILLSSMFWVTQASAQSTVISLIHESENGEQNYWWKGSTPAFTDLDKELASSFRPLTVKLIQPKISVSRVFRTNELSDKQASTIASLFKAQNVIHGKLKLAGIEEVAGQQGIKANLSVSLIGKNGTNTQTFSSIAYANDIVQAKILAKRTITNQLAQFVNWASAETRSGGVGYPLSKMDLFLENGNGQIISKLTEEFKLNKAVLTPIWVSESGIAFRVSSADANAIQRIVDRVKSDEISFDTSRKDQGLLIKGIK